jgi:hypothetical protein
VFGEKGSGARKAEKSVDVSCWIGTNRWSRRANSREQGETEGEAGRAAVAATEAEESPKKGKAIEEEWTPEVAVMEAGESPKERNQQQATGSGEDTEGKEQREAEGAADRAAVAGTEAEKSPKEE